MPYAFIILGLIMIVTGARNTYAQFGAQVTKDFTGPGNFTWWLASLGLVGAVGYIPKLRPVSTAFMTLIVIVLVVAAKGLFPKLTQALNAGPTAPQAATSDAMSLGQAAANSVSAVTAGTVTPGTGTGLPAAANTAGLTTGGVGGAGLWGDVQRLFGGGSQTPNQPGG